MKVRRALAALLLALVYTVAVPGLPAAAQSTGPTGPTGAPAGVGPFQKGAVVALRGTPHLWFADDRGTLHWGGDTRALANRDILWSSRAEVSLEQLRTLPRGEPWLSTAFVRIGDAISLARWDSTAGAPALLRVQSAADLQVFGVDTSSYQSVVLEQAAWEQKFGHSADRLPRGDLAPTGAAPAAPADPWSPFTSAAGGFAFWAPGAAAPPAAAVPDLLASAAALAGGRGVPGLPADPHFFLFGSYLDGPATLYAAGSVSLPDEAVRQLDLLGPDAIFELVRAEIARSNDVRLTGYRSITQGVYRGREVTLEPRLSGEAALAGSPFASVSITFRIFVVDDKAVAIAAVKVPAAAGSPDVAKFLDSLQLLPS